MSFRQGRASIWKYYALGILLLIVFAIITIYGRINFTLVSTVHFQADQLIAHALGGIASDHYTNSYDAFLYSYSVGYKIFEVDCQLTVDNHVILAHDYNHFFPSIKNRTLEEVLLSSYKGKYFPLSITSLIVIMKRYPDIIVDIDGKCSNKQSVLREYKYILEKVQQYQAEDVLDRMMVEIYSPQMYDLILSVYPFRQLIFSLYKIWDGRNTTQFEQFCRWSSTHNISAIALWAHLFNETTASILRKYHIPVFLHTVDNIDTAKQYFDLGARKIYTNTIRPTSM